MLNRLPADERRRQLIGAALAIAERSGVAAVTVRAVAEEAGVSLGVVYYCFDSKEELVAATGETLVEQLSMSLREGFAEVRKAPEVTGVDGLRTLIHIGLSGMWPFVEATPGSQLLTYEITALALRQRATTGGRAGGSPSGSTRRWTARPSPSSTSARSSRASGSQFRWRR
ncbi:TetR/AcrR family transcriptional regulator [Rhodococcus rhodnii]|uniref:TetR family transcriptional regulator n=1 Tax=Rhodococcus rhodnii LMG 5362 TaxID=1273125 RepID=R7WQ22_9NOCA|nr:TetR/AcrR family transcriptional regulator [Rhodococcus rhodnii]EOM77355.1 TetR family transcriptional regulator [Rhodococcus rhodnii LMG 5362]